jgi:hypothetical protein
MTLCFDDIGVSGVVCGGLIQSSSTALGSRMCVEPVESMMGRRAIKSHDVKAVLPSQLAADPAARFWFLKGSTRGRQLVTLDQCWDCSVITEDILARVPPEPANVGQWVILLDGLSDGRVATSGDTFVEEFAIRFPMAVTPRTTRRVCYDRAVSTPDSWEDFVELDVTSIATDSTASTGTVQKRLRETLPIVINNVETVKNQRMCISFGPLLVAILINMRTSCCSCEQKWERGLSSWGHQWFGNTLTLPTRRFVLFKMQPFQPHWLRSCNR